MATNTTLRHESVYVVPDRYEFQVVPPVVRLSAGDTLTVRNLTDSWVHVSFPRTVMTPPEGDIEPRGSAPFTVLAGAPAGVYSYSVKVIFVQADLAKGTPEISLHARGGSEPRIIIDF